jgi:predicted nucleic acid-binding protein
MTTLMVDASVWLAALDPDDVNHAPSRALLVKATEGKLALAALDLTLYEVANVAAVRTGSVAKARRAVQLVRITAADLLQSADESLLHRAATLAVEHGLSVYDAAYVAAARERGWILVSGDDKDLVKPGHGIAPAVALAKA